MSPVTYLPVELIRSRADARRHSDEDLASLEESIDQVGLLYPIVVRRIGEHFEVVSGALRLQAMELRGERLIPCIVVDLDDRQAELAMIDANLCQVELSPTERAKQTVRRQVIYLELHPETRHGGDRRSDQLANLATRSFTAETATLSGISERKVRRDAARGAAITDEASALIRRSKLDTGAYLDKISRVPKGEQSAKVQRDLTEISSRPRLPGAMRLAKASGEPATQPHDSAKSYLIFLKDADEISRLDIDELIVGCGNEKARLAQYASSLLERATLILERISR